MCKSRREQHQLLRCSLSMVKTTHRADGVTLTLASLNAAANTQRLRAHTVQLTAECHGCARSDCMQRSTLRESHAVVVPYRCTAWALRA